AAADLLERLRSDPETSVASLGDPLALPRQVGLGGGRRGGRLGDRLRRNLGFGLGLGLASRASLVGLPLRAGLGRRRLFRRRRARRRLGRRKRHLPPDEDRQGEQRGDQ
ncbi:MAG: hypothetical protein R3244_05230, partial [Thermoanaerobaculia bacterium]|nr:hypothetical protein [Thermoanaerobaculia bacterium]